ncbi:MAG: response regulator [Candidatus Sumerlaeota bacterium]|nr:response regulator [Candidatus Sumerlaeota bacterium]
MNAQALPAEVVGQARVLVVDDEPDIRELLKDMLELEGHSVETAEDGLQAQQMLSDKRFDLVITDLQMPRVDGMQLIQSIRALDPDLPVIVMTAYPSMRSVIDVMKCGAVDFLPKPFQMDNVLYTVRRTLKEHALRLENRRLLAEVNNKAVIERLNRELHSKVEELTKLNVIAEHLGRLMDTDQLFDQVVQLAAALTEGRRVSLMLFDRRQQHLRIRASVGISPDLMRDTAVRLGEGIAGKVAQTRMPNRVTSRQAVSLGPGLCHGDRYASGSWVSVPLLIGDELFGVLNVTEREGQSDFGPEDERVLMALAEKAAAKVENNALYESLYDNLLDTLRSLITTIEAKDPYTHQHSQRVTELALALGKGAGLSRDQMESLRFATTLHDIGKIGVQDSILGKKGRLSAPEYETIKAHPVIGDRIVEPLGLSDAERDIIRHHHERIDGRGYPDSLCGDEVSTLARIVAVADAFDAMTSTRPYREALSIEAAIDELTRCSGQQFDPDIVDLLVQGIRDGAIRIPTLEEREVLSTAMAV